MRVGGKLGGFNSMISRVRVGSPPRHFKKSYSCSVRGRADDDHHHHGDDMNFNINKSSEMMLKQNDTENGCGNRVMVVVDSTIEAKAALQWVLSHTVQNHDTILLLHVTNPSNLGSNINGEANQRAYELLCSMKKKCQLKRPEVKVETEMRQGKEKGATIVEAAKEQGVSLLVLGQRKQSIMWKIRRIFWAGKKSQNNRAVDYCIQNASCMTIAVRRKGKSRGGYLITTKKHKNFWLLA